MALSFAQALREFNSDNQKARVVAARRLLKEAGEPGVVSSVISHDPESGFRPGVMAALGVPDEYARQAAQYLGSWHGTLTQQPRVVAFHVGEGPDRMHTIRATVQPAALADALRAAGVHHFTLRTSPTHTHAHVYDASGTRDFTGLAQGLPGGYATHVGGTGFRLGQGAGADAGSAGPASAAYRDSIRAAEAGAEADGVPPAGVVKLSREAVPSLLAAAREGQKTGQYLPTAILADALEESGMHADEKSLVHAKFAGPHDITPGKGGVRIRQRMPDTQELLPGRHVIHWAPDRGGGHHFVYTIPSTWQGGHTFHITRFSGERHPELGFLLAHRLTEGPSSTTDLEEAIRVADKGASDTRRVSLARKKGGPYAKELKPWAAALAEVPDDAGRRGILADWLEEHGHHHSEADIHRLRTHVGDMFITRHPVSGKVVAVPGKPVATLEGLLKHREANSLPALMRDYAPPTHLEFIHGPQGIAAVHAWPTDEHPDGDHFGVSLFDPMGRMMRRATDSTNNDSYHVHGTGPRPREVARRHALRHAFDTPV